MLTGTGASTPSRLGSPDVRSLEAGIQAFRNAFLKWVNALDTGQWENIRDLPKADAERWKAR